ncbi:YetF domain-containing protein [Bacillus sp. REN10]|uniref:DUF421 domain-containing protein n=1 Tax=Bacillus sp. REN10 TaxID=2782541 RepID=UPI00193B6F8F|nr:YetF domain-containing protein [Bacillus sp. REN10]
MNVEGFLEVVGKACLMLLVGIVLLRIAGRKSVTHMTVVQTVIMISIGSIIIQPFIEHKVLGSVTAASVFIILLLFMEWLQLKFNFMEWLLTGVAIPVVQDGQLVEKNLRKLRYTVDQLETKLREQGVSSIDHVKWTTVEPNGKIGYELKEEYKPLTKKDLYDLFPHLFPSPIEKPASPLFKETDPHSSLPPVPERLQ